MKFEIIVETEISKFDWDDSLLRNIASTTYQAISWQKMFSIAYGSIPIFISAIDENKQILGQVAAVIHHEWFWQNSGSLAKKFGKKFDLGKELHWFYGPIIYENKFRSQILTRILDALEDVAIKHNVGIIRGISPPLDSDFINDEFTEFGYSIQPWSTYIVNLEKSTDELFKKLNKNTRYDIRKAEKNNLEFEVVENLDTLLEYKNLKFQAKKRDGGKVEQSEKFLQTHWKILSKINHEKFFLAKQNGEYVGGIFTLTFNKNIVQHGVVNIKPTLQGGPFLTWNVIKWGIENNFKTFDLAGVNPNPKNQKEKQIQFYKSKWGGDKITYYLYTKIVNSKKANLSLLLKNPNKLTLGIQKIMQKRDSSNME